MKKIARTANFLNLITFKLDKHVVLLPINFIASQTIHFRHYATKEIEILSNLTDEIPPLSNHCQVTVNRVDATLCADWLVSITCCFSLHLIG